MNKEELIEKARLLRQQDDLEGSQELLLTLLDEYPRDAVVLYEVGGAYDVLDEQKKAIPYYQKAIKAGLSGDDLQECLICLGICQRSIGDFDTAVTTLKNATQKFPDNNGARIFLALAYYSAAQEDEAVRILLDLLLQTSSDEDIQAYADTIDFYKDHLDDIWDD